MTFMEEKKTTHELYSGPYIQQGSNDLANTKAILGHSFKEKKLKTE